MTDTTEARPAAPSDAPRYTLTVEETADRYDKAGVPRTIRRIQKYCARGDLDCKKVETDFGEKYFISEESIDRHIAQIRDAQDAAGRALTRPSAPERPLETNDILIEKEDAPGDAPVRPDASGRDFQDLYIRQLETENAFLRDQAVVILERIKETHVLTQGLQQLLSPLTRMLKKSTEENATNPEV
jgi:hypothetical protein